MRLLHTWLLRVRVSGFRFILGLGRVPSPCQSDHETNALADAYRRLAVLEARASLIGLSTDTHDAHR